MKYKTIILNFFFKLKKKMSGTTYSFQANIKELINLMIHSFYSSRDIFLRDLLSTSSDALEKQTHLFFQTELV